jgi:hypothetical protein
MPAFAPSERFPKGERVFVDAQGCGGRRFTFFRMLSMLTRLMRAKRRT